MWVIYRAVFYHAFIQHNDFGPKELGTNAAIISNDYTVLCFEVLDFDEYRYLAALDYS